MKHSLFQWEVRTKPQESGETFKLAAATFQCAGIRKISLKILKSRGGIFRDVFSQSFALHCSFYSNRTNAVYIVNPALFDRDVFPRKCRQEVGVCQ